MEISKAVMSYPINSHWGLLASDDGIPHCAIFFSHFTLLKYSSKCKIAASGWSERFECRVNPPLPVHLFREESRFGSSLAISAASPTTFCTESDDSRLVFLVLLLTSPLSFFSFGFLETVFPRDDVFVFVAVLLFFAFKSAELDETGEDKDDWADDPASVSRLALWTTARTSMSAYYWWRGDRLQTINTRKQNGCELQTNSM